MAVFMRTDGCSKYVLPAKNGKFTRKELQTYVGGRIEVVRLDDSRCIIRNEKGKIKKLPLNVYATQLYGQDVIVGDVLVLVNDEWE